MKWTGQRKLITGGFSAALGVLAIIGVISYRTTSSLIRAVEARRHSFETIKKLEILLSELKDAETGQRGYLLTGRENYLEPYESALGEISQTTEDVRDLTAGNREHRQALRALEGLIEVKLSLLKQTIRLRKENHPEAALQIVLTNKGKNTMDEIRKITDEMQNREEKLLKGLRSEMGASAREATLTLLFGISVSFVLLLWVFFLLNREITERARVGTELALSVEGLRKQTVLFESILRSIGDGVIVADEKGKFLNWNPAAEQILGLGAMDVPIDQLTEKYGFYLPDKITPYPAAQVPLARAVRGEVATKEEMFVRNELRPAGVWVWATGTPLCDQAGVTRGGVVVLSEITERKQAEEALIRDANELALSVESLRRQTDLFQSILRSIGDGVVVADENGKFLNWNPAAEQILGLGAMDVPLDQLTETYGCYLPDKVTPYPASQLPLARAIRGELTKNEDMFIRNHRRPEGVWISVTGTPLKDGIGVMCGGVVVLSEITERIRAVENIRNLNHDLERKTAELEATNKELEAFTYSVAHDLRAPLRHIDGFSKMLEEETDALNDDAKRFVTRIRGGTRQMGQLVDDLLNLARLGRKELSLQVAGLSTLAEEAAGELKRENTDRSIEWKIGALPFAECDPALMKQVFVNLLSNAAKYTRPRHDAQIEVGTIDVDGQPAIFVRDNGVGFSMKYADKLFGVFQRLHRAEDFEGTGVGLATVQRIIRKHGGRVWAEAELDKGATFYFTLGGGESPALNPMSRESKVESRKSNDESETAECETKAA